MPIRLRRRLLFSNHHSIYSNRCRFKREKKMNNCNYCGALTLNPKYCSKSCSAKQNNTIKPKRTMKLIYCRKCGTTINRVSWKDSPRRKLCLDCNPNNIDWSNVTYGEVINKAKYQKNSRIRGLARVAYKKSGLPRTCLMCGYATHIEVCHIKPISSFDDNAKITEINNIDNLAPLCPNCHWELDNFILNADKLKQARRDLNPKQPNRNRS